MVFLLPFHLTRIKRQRTLPLKAVSFLPMGNKTYPQQPYTQITKDEYNSYVGQIKKINWSAIYDGVDNLEALGEAYCTTDTCEIKIS
jgi:hypothetical protein